MTDTIAVRAATLRDLDALVPLFEGYRAFYRCSPREAAAREFLRDRLSRSDSVILVACDAGGVLMGFVQLYPTFSSLQMARALILNDLYVAKERRGGGVARALMSAARVFAESSGAVSLSLETATDNASARALYESLGYHLERDFLHYTLDTAAGAADDQSTRQNA
jgi:ribosomal protein S18 acetylase RimI-like enzyme